MKSTSNRNNATFPALTNADMIVAGTKASSREGNFRLFRSKSNCTSSTSTGNTGEKSRTAPGRTKSSSFALNHLFPFSHKNQTAHEASKDFSIASSSSNNNNKNKCHVTASPSSKPICQRLQEQQEQHHDYHHHQQQQKRNQQPSENFDEHDISMSTSHSEKKQNHRSSFFSNVTSKRRSSSKRHNGVNNDDILSSHSFSSEAFEYCEDANGGNSTFDDVTSTVAVDDDHHTIISTSSSAQTMNKTRPSLTSSAIIKSFRNKKKQNFQPKKCTSDGDNDEFRLSPQSHIDELLVNRGYSTKKYETIKTAYYNEPTSLQRACYTSYIQHLAKKGNTYMLRKLLQSGLSPNPCNYNGSETLLNTICRMGLHEVVKVMLECGSSLQVSDNSGKTPLHAACSSGIPSFPTIDLLLRNDRQALFMVDNYGLTPLMYVRKEFWGAWIKFLNNQKDIYWPVQVRNSEVLGYEPSPILTTMPANSRPLPNPSNAMAVELARIVALGNIEPEEALSYQLGGNSETDRIGESENARGDFTYSNIGSGKKDRVNEVDDFDSSEVNGRFVRSKDSIYDGSYSNMGSENIDNNDDIEEVWQKSKTTPQLCFFQGADDSDSDEVQDEVTEMDDTYMFEGRFFKSKDSIYDGSLSEVGSGNIDYNDDFEDEWESQITCATRMATKAT